MWKMHPPLATHNLWRKRVMVCWVTLYYRSSYTCMMRLMDTIDCAAEYTHTMHTETSWRSHDDVMNWKHFLRYWPFVRGIHRSPMDSPSQRPVTRNFDVFFDLRPKRGCASNRDAGDLRRHRAHYDVTVMTSLWKIALKEWLCKYM